jgi:hypothetical protein
MAMNDGLYIPPSFRKHRLVLGRISFCLTTRHIRGVQAASPRILVNHAHLGVKTFRKFTMLRELAAAFQAAKILCASFPPSTALLLLPPSSLPIPKSGAKTVITLLAKKFKPR